MAKLIELRIKCVICGEYIWQRQFETKVEYKRGALLMLFVADFNDHMRKVHKLGHKFLDLNTLWIPDSWLSPEDKEKDRKAEEEYNKKFKFPQHSEEESRK